MIKGTAQIRGGKELSQRIGKKIATAPLTNEVIVQDACMRGVEMLRQTAPTFSTDLAMSFFYFLVPFKKTTRGYINNYKKYYWYADKGRGHVYPKRRKWLRYWYAPPQANWNPRKVFSQHSGPARGTFFVEEVTQVLATELRPIASKRINEWLRT